MPPIFSPPSFTIHPQLKHYPNLFKFQEKYDPSGNFKLKVEQYLNLKLLYSIDGILDYRHHSTQTLYLIYIKDFLNLKQIQG